MATELPTWGGKQRFRYEFDRSTLDVRIFCGDNCSRIYQLDGASLREALVKFSGKESLAGTHRSSETSKLDALRDATQRTITLLRERRAALIAVAVTGQIEIAAATAAGGT
jgi:hypothetical protein